MVPRILCHELLVGQPPLILRMLTVLTKKLRRARFVLPTVREEPRALIALLQRDPKARLGATQGGQELKQHVFFTGVDWQAVFEMRVDTGFDPQSTEINHHPPPLPTPRHSSLQRTATPWQQRPQLWRAISTPSSRGSVRPIRLNSLCFGIRQIQSLQILKDFRSEERQPIRSPHPLRSVALVPVQVPLTLHRYQQPGH